MIYLRSSRRGGAVLGAEADALDRDYLDALIRLNEPSGLRLTIEASNGTELQGGIKETTLSARLFAKNGTDLTVHLPLLALTWEIGVNGEWEEVGTGWSYRAGIRNEYRNTYRVRTTHLEVAKTLGEEVTDAGLRRILQELIIACEITITNSYALISQIPTADLIKDRLKQDRQFLVSVKGDKGDSVTLADLNIRWEDDKLTIGGAKSRSLKGQDAPPVRPNLIKRGESLYPNMGYAADSVEVTYKEGVYRITKHDRMYRIISMYTRPLLQQKSTKTRIVSWRVVGASRPELLRETQILNKGGRYYTIGNKNHEEQWVRGGVYAYPFDGEENHWIDGDWIEFADLKVELVEDGEPIEPTAHIPHIDDLKGDSVTALQVVAELNKTDIFALTVRDALKQDSAFLSSVKGDKGERGLQGIKGADGKSVTVSEVTTSLKQDTSFLASVKGDKGERGLQGPQGIKGADGKSVTPEEAVNALMQDQVSLRKIRKDILESNQATQLVSERIKKEVTQAVTLSDSSNTMRLPDIHTIEEGALYRIAIIPNGYCLLEFVVVSSQDIITPMFDNLGRQHTQKALFCDGAFALFERLGERWMWRNYCDFAYHKNKIQKELEELRLSTIEDNIRALRNGAVNSFVNLGSIQSGSYHLKPSDYIIFARATGNGDKNPWIYLDDASIEVGANFFVIVPSTDITCEFKIPTGTAINGNTQVNKGLYLLVKTWATEWICTSISTM